MTLLRAILFLFMTSASILAAVEDALKPLIEADKGMVSVAETEEDALQMLSEGPERWSVILCLDGDKPAEDWDYGGWVSGRLVAYVQAPKGTEINRGRSINRESVRGTPAFFTRLHWIIRKIRGLSLIATDIDVRGFEYLGWDWLRYDGQAAFRTAKASFDLHFAHDDPATDPDGTAPVVLPSPFRIIAAAGEFYTIALSGTAHGRVPRYEPEAGDPNGNGSGYEISGEVPAFYTVAYDGAPHGRIPRYEA